MASNFQALRPSARYYIALVVIAGGAVIAQSVHSLAVDPISNRWAILAVLTLLTGSFNVKVPSINAYISVSEAFVFASILLFGTPAGTATVLIECFVILLWMKREARLLHRVLFNMAAPAVAVWVAGTAFYLLSGIEPYSKAFTPLPTLFLPLLAFTALYFLINSWLVAVAVGLENSRSPVNIWWKNFAWLSVNYFSGASLAALIVINTKQLDFSSLAVIVPLLVVSYLTFRTAMGRAEDSYNHLSELNRLYLSTIETLAMAIDAKDQITHGHIRRVQAYAVGLARKIGVSDEQLKAIEAAALLHDMGKLAVPEHILNKPGKLTAAEFEKMKLHASVGADILSAIDFPYPVVPIVRHHHESWNGSGYPDGLRGVDIPIGARILSVVDCFDALTSDRPYRARLSDDDAIAILMSRRGSMYDPLVVDTFIRVHKEIAPPPAPNELPPVPAASHRGESLKSTAGMSRRAAASAVERHFESAEIVDAIDRLKQTVPFSLGILFQYDQERDELVAKHVAGDPQGIVRDLRIPVGDRLSGWVAANRRAIVNSDPLLDLGELINALKLELKTSLSVPLLNGDDIVGVLTLYSTSERFSDNDRRGLEYLAANIVARVSTAPALDHQDNRDQLTGLTFADGLPSRLQRLVSESMTSSRFALMYVEIRNIEQINKRQGAVISDKALLQLSQQIQKGLKADDQLFRTRTGGFVGLLRGADGSSLNIKLNDIRRVATTASEPINGQHVQLDIHIVLAPNDAGELTAFVADAGLQPAVDDPQIKSSRVH